LDVLEFLVPDDGIDERDVIGHLTKATTERVNS
jgi:hypothetical protein